MFRIKMLPARYGDSLWIEYGRPSNPRRVLIDGGLASTYDILRAHLLGLLSSQRHFDLMVVTHVDADHIEGMITLLADRDLSFTTDDFWFNAWRHLSPAPRSLLGPLHGEFLSAMIDARRFNWNRSFCDGSHASSFAHPPVVIQDDRLPEVTLDGGMKLTLLTPDRAALGKLKRVWKREVQKAGLEAGDLPAWKARLYDTPRLLPASLLGDQAPGLEALAQAESKKDTSVANGSSIAFLAEFEGKSCLFAADAQPGQLSASLRRLLAARPGQERLPLNAFKVAHHGGSKNFTPELASLIDCERYLFSTNGERYGHPEKETIARLLTTKRSPCQLLFNYCSDANQAWADPQLKARYQYEVDYPADNERGLTIEL
jgi:beta-lactamase superfamily II metal-dependent hydrolase